MSRNAQSRFALNPGVSVSRSRFDRSSRHLTTFNAGELIPIYFDEVLPGDTFDMSTTKLVRMTTSVHPTMDNAYLDTFFFFVPYRLLWEHWEEFNGANDKAWTQDVIYTIPQLKLWNGTGDAPITGSMSDHLGAAILGENVSSNITVSALPFRACFKIWNDYFRDENLQPELSFPIDDGPDVPNDYRAEPFTSGANINKTNLRVAKFHDYFTSCLPGPQKGQDVLIPASGDAQVIWNAKNAAAGTSPADKANVGVNTDISGNPGLLGYWNGGSFVNFSSLVNAQFDAVANLNAVQITVNNLRLAVQTQKLLEKDARGGTRYQEIIFSHFGVRSPDARLQRSEYLGGKSTPINMTEIAQTSATEITGSSSPLGSLAGFSATADKEDAFVKSFTEHGCIIGLACVRTERSYSQGMHRHWFRKNRLDFYLPVLAHIGEQPVFNREIYFENNSTTNSVFGYQEAWADYRYKPNMITGYFRPNVPETLASWHYGDFYTARPILGNSWIQQGAGEVDRTLAYSSSVAPQFIGDFYFKCYCTRPMPVFSIPGFVDHF